MKKTMFSLLLSVALILSLNSLSWAATEYTDIGGLEQSLRQAIQQVTEQQLFEGYPDGSFQPKSVISRAEFAVVVVRLSGLTDFSRPAL